MNKKNKLLAGILFICSMQTSAQNTMTLRECVETGIANNFDVQQKQLQAESAEANWKQSKLNMLPDLNAGAGHSFNQGRSIDPFTNSPVTQSFNSSNYSVGSGVVLFNGLVIQNSIRQNSLTYQASRMDWQQEKDNLTINIILAYLEVLSSADQLAQARSQAALSEEQVKRLEVLNREGAIKPSDLSDVRGQYATDQLSIISTQNALESARIRLAGLMNVPYNRNLVLEKIEPETFAARYEETPEKIYETALQDLALVKAAEFRKQSAARAIKVARGQLFPTLSFNGNAFTNYSSVAMQSRYLNTTDRISDDYVVVNGSQLPLVYKQDHFNSSKISYNDQLNNNLYTSFGFNLNIPIFNSLQQRNRIRQAKINYKSSELVVKTTKTQLGQAIDQAYVNMNTAAERYKAILLQIDAFTESFRAAGIRFDSGVGNSIDYLTAKNNLDRASINLIIAKYDYVLRTKILDYYQGKQLW